MNEIKVNQYYKLRLYMGQKGTLYELKWRYFKLSYGYNRDQARISLVRPPAAELAACRRLKKMRFSRRKNCGAGPEKCRKMSGGVTTRCQ